MTDAVVAFMAPLPPPGLRRRSETRRVGYRAKLKRAYSRAVYGAWQAAGAPRPRRPWQQARLRLVWRAVRPPDRDNVMASCKALVDALRCQQASDGEGRWWLGLIENDDPDCLLAVEADVERLRHRSEGEGVWVELTRA